MVDRDTQLMDQYATYLDEWVTAVTSVCQRLHQNAGVAVQCVDSASAARAVARLDGSIENIEKALPVTTGTARKLVRARRYLDEARDVFRR